MFRSILLAAAAVAAAAFLAGDAAARPINQKDLVALDRVSDAHVSPDGRWAAYDLTTLKPDGAGRQHSVWVVPTDASAAPRKLVDGATPRWDGDAAVFFVREGQIWRTCLACAAPAQQVTHLPLEVGSYRVAPDGRHLVVSLSVFPDADDPAATKARLDARAQQSSGRVYDRIFVRHWDEWADGARNHLFAIPLRNGAQAGPMRPLMAGFDGDTPSKPFGDDGEYAISPDGRSVVFSVRIAGKSEPWSTNFDLYRAPIDGSARPENLTAGNPAWDGGPVFAPDGRLVWRAMKRPGFESDRFGVVTLDGAGRPHELDPAWDHSAEQVAVSGDGRTLYVEAEDSQHAKLFAMDAATGAARPLTGEGHVSGFDVANTPGGDVIVYTRDAFDEPGDVYALRPGGQPLRLTHTDAAQLAGVDFSAFETFSFPGWNGETVRGWVVKPAGWRPGQRYPTVLLVHCGPQGSWSDAWSYRWNPEVWAGWGYAVVMIDPHGSTGYGQAFTDAVSGHWGDRPLEDLQKGWSAVQAKYPWIDGDRACAAGASYGGFMIYWMAGVWNGPWKCLIDHDGVFDNRIMGYATEELWFSQWENGGGMPWQDPAAYERFNPVNHVAAWTKPMLVVHSERDFRIPLEQGLGAFTAMQRKGVPSRFMTFTDENHWVRKPKNSLLWHDTIQAWLDQWIGAGAKPAGR